MRWRRIRSGSIVRKSRIILEGFFGGPRVSFTSRSLKKGQISAATNVTGANFLPRLHPIFDRRASPRYLSAKREGNDASTYQCISAANRGDHHRCDPLDTGVVTAKRSDCPYWISSRFERPRSAAGDLRAAVTAGTVSRSSLGVSSSRRPYFRAAYAHTRMRAEESLLAYTGRFRAGAEMRSLDVRPLILDLLKYRVLSPPGLSLGSQRSCLGWAATSRAMTAGRGDSSDRTLLWAAAPRTVGAAYRTDQAEKPESLSPARRVDGLSDLGHSVYWGSALRWRSCPAPPLIV
jgi:hypothetical protein